MTTALTPVGITNVNPDVLRLVSLRSGVAAPSGSTPEALLLTTERFATWRWSATIGVWALAGRTMGYIDPTAAGLPLPLGARTTSIPVFGTTAVRTTGQIWPV